MASTRKSEAQRLLDLIHEKRIQEADKVEPGYMSVFEWAELWDQSITNVRRLLRIGEEKKLLESKKFKVAKKGRYTKMVFYRAIK